MLNFSETATREARGSPGKRDSEHDEGKQEPLGPTPRRPLSSKFRISLATAAITLLVGSWLSSGTMAPYAATLDPALIRIQKPCGYLTNIDHPHFRATFLMLQGKPREQWQGSVVLRRLLYPILAFPLMTALGFESGGFATNVIITLAAFVGFSIFVYRALGQAAAVTAMWLLATYPGITYWIGLPYSYVWIVPGSLLLTMLLCKLSRTTHYLCTLVLSVAMGFCFWGYDLFPFFGIASLVALAWRRRFLQMLVALLGMTIPMGVLFAGLKVVFRLPLLNSNTGVYWVVLKSFASPVDYPAWWKLVAAVPSIFVDNFLDS